MGAFRPAAPPYKACELQEGLRNRRSEGTGVGIGLADGGSVGTRHCSSRPRDAVGVTRRDDERVGPDK
jgi:hypothetical protein